MATVQQMLDDARIKANAVSPEQLIAKVRYAVNLANARGSGIGLGKRLKLEPIGAVGTGLKLHEIKWTLDNGNTGLRIVFQDIGNGKYELVGILLKKSLEQQTRYLAQLAKTLRDRSE